MRTFSFKRDLRVKIEGAVYRLVSKFEEKGVETWQIERLSDHLLVNRTSDELLTLYCDEQLHLDTDDEDETPQRRKARLRRERTVIGDLPEAQKAHIARMKHIIHEVDRRVGLAGKTKKRPGQSESPLEIALREICAELGLEKAISQATYYRALAKYKKHGNTNDLISRTSERGCKTQIPEQVKTWLLQALGELLVGGRGRTIVNARAAVKARIDEARRLDPTLNWKLPSRKTFFKYWALTSAYDRAVQKFGPTRARHMFRSAKGHDGPEACLDLVEFDETRLPFYVIDEAFGVPLGAPILAWILDVRCQAPMGLYLGFEPPGDIAITSAIRHAMLPKTYMRTLYPDIRHPLPVGGRFRQLTLDNGLTQHGHTVEDISLSAEFDFKFTPVRTPWFKPNVECSFKVLNQALLEDLPGFQPPPGTILEAYDPKGHGLIGFNALLFIIHKWLADEYMLKPHSGLGARPIDLWEESTRLYPPEWLGSKTDLEALFGIIRVGTLDHRGVVYEQIRYRSDELDLLLRQRGQLRKHGAMCDVPVKVNFDNLRTVRVFDPAEHRWIKAEARRLDYADGLSLHRHQLYRKHARARGRPQDPDEWLIAHHEIQEFVQQALPVNLGIGVNKSIARALGIGSHTLTAQIGIDGQFVEPARSASPAAEFSIPVAPARQGLASTPPVPVPAPAIPRIRQIPKYEADTSLRATPRSHNGG